MIKTSTLTGARLDYWTARAEGVPAENLEIRPVQRSDKHHCVRVAQREGVEDRLPIGALNYQGAPALWAPLIEKHKLDVTWDKDRDWCANDSPLTDLEYGATPQEAICRAVVRAAFGDEVEDVPCQ